MTIFKDIAIDSPLTGFGELLTGSRRPTIQVTGVYDTLPPNFTTYTATGGSAQATGRMLQCATGTSVGGYGVIQSLRANIYRAGQAGDEMFTAAFTTGVASSFQAAGMLSIGDGLAFGYNGTAFGTLHRYGGLVECRRITVTVGSSGSTNLTLTLNTVGYTIPLTAGTTAFNAYEIATWLNANQTVWLASQNGSTVVLVAESDGAKSGTYSYSHATSTGTIAQVRAGVTKTEDWTPQASWNRNTASWIDPTKLNIYRIVYPFLGAGNIDFQVFDRTTRDLVTVHQLLWQNLNTTPSLGNPSMRIGIAAASLGSTTNLTVKSASLNANMQGEKIFTRNTRAYENFKSIGTTETNILTIRNRTEFNGYVNQGNIEPIKVTLANNSTKLAVFYIRSNVTLGGTPNYFYVDQNENIAELDISGTTISGGKLVAAYYVAPDDTLPIDLAELVKISPNVAFTISGKVTSGAASDLGAALVWYEDF